MSTIIIILAITLGIILSVFLAIRAYNRPKVERQITERQENTIEARENRRDRIKEFFTRRRKRPRLGEKPKE